MDYLLEWPCGGDSQKYPQHRFLGVKKGKKSFLSFIILVHVGILHSSKVFLTAESWRTNAVNIRRLLCNKLRMQLEKKEN